MNTIDAHRRWSVLFRVASAAAWASATSIPIQVAVFLLWPPPLDGTAADWLALFRDRPVVGLIDLDLLLVAVNVLLIVILLALLMALQTGHESAMTVACAIGFASILMYVASNPAVQMAVLSDQYYSATTEQQRQAAQAAADTVLANWQGTAFHIAYILGSIAGIIIGVVMVRSAVFSRATGWLGIAANTVAFGLYVPRVGVFISIFSVVFLEIWYLLVAHRLGRLAGSAVQL